MNNKTSIVSISLIVFMLHVLSVYGQKEGNIWYFGDHAGLNFNTNPPTALTNGALKTFEGCATISDKYGKLLFYTDGSSVWNRNHQLMAEGTGLKGSSGSTQSGVIVPHPGNPNLYYVFTVTSNAWNDGFRYSLVDISMNNGLGEVITKNIPLLSPSTEKVTAVAHRDQRKYWVIAHGWGDNTFYSYLVDENGINPTPVVSNVGSVHSGGALQSNAIGYMKVSPLGNKIALTKSDDGLIELFDFDNNTGKISNPLSFKLGDDVHTYGLEFSPNASKLYCGNMHKIPGYIYQIDLKAGSPTDIINSKIIVGISKYKKGALQVGSNGKIYVTNLYATYLGVINNPNEKGLACHYIDSAVSLDGRECNLGLPTFIQSFFDIPLFTVDHHCTGEDMSFKIVDTTLIDSVVWQIKENDKLTFSHDFSPTHLFEKTGKYEVKLIAYSGNLSEEATREIQVDPYPNFNLGPVDQTICKGEKLKFNVSTKNASYQWQDGSKDSVYSTNEEGRVWVQVSNECATVKDSTLIKVDTKPQIDFGNDTVLCKNEILELKVDNGNAPVFWQDGSTSPKYTVKKKGLYKVTVNSSCGIFSDEIFIDYKDCPCEVYVPNAFSPNNDGINDTLRPVYECNFDHYELKIFNRWGEMIFKSENPSAGWTGPGKEGNTLFYYLLRYRGYLGGKYINKTKTGTISLVR